MPEGLLSLNAGYARILKEKDMYIVGELINASRKKIATAIKNKDEKYITRIAIEQDKAGADLIDVNAGIFENHEAEHLQWLVENVQSVTDKPCCIDSPDPKAIEAALDVYQGPTTPMINSISLEKNRWKKLLQVERCRYPSFRCSMIRSTHRRRHNPKTLKSVQWLCFQQAQRLINQLYYPSLCSPFRGHQTGL